MERLDRLCLADLTADEECALRAYKAAREITSGVSSCFDLNRDLRNGLWVKELDSSLSNIALSLDGIFARCPRLQEETTVYRGVGTRAHMPLHEKGKRFRNLEYWSTACSKEAAKKFLQPVSQPGHGAILVLHLPVGFPAYDMETLPGFGGDEAELLLPRGVLWRIETTSLIPGNKLTTYLREKFANLVCAEMRPARCYEEPLQ